MWILVYSYLFASIKKIHLALINILKQIYYPFLTYKLLGILKDLIQLLWHSVFITSLNYLN